MAAETSRRHRAAEEQRAVASGAGEDKDMWSYSGAVLPTSSQESDSARASQSRHSELIHLLVLVSDHPVGTGYKFAA